MKYKLLQNLPGIKAGEIFQAFDEYTALLPVRHYMMDSKGKRHDMNPIDYPDFFDPIIEKKRYEDLKRNDMIFEIEYDGIVYKSHFELDSCRSETFLTREEAEDEHKRREWACRKDKFIPKHTDDYFYPGIEGQVHSEIFNKKYSYHYFFVNFGLAFKSKEECEKAIREHDIVRLFYTIR